MKVPTLFTTTTYFTSASRKLFQQHLSASHVVLKWEAFLGGGSMLYIATQVPAMLMERFAQHLMNAASQVVGYASLGAANGADFESRVSLQKKVNLRHLQKLD